MTNNRIKKEILEINAFGEEFRICRNLKYLPLTAYPSYIQTGLIVFCLKGSARINIHDNEHLLSENQLAVFFPGQLISCRDISDDFLTLTLSLSSTFYDDILSGMRRFSPHFFVYMRSHFWFPLNEREVAGFCGYFNLISDRVKREQVDYLKRGIDAFIEILLS